jgi:lactate racemase
MVHVELAYGRHGLNVTLPDQRADVVEPRDIPGLRDEAAAIEACLDEPHGTPALRDLASSGNRVVIVVNDGTRPMPSDRVLPGILARLSHIPRHDITILVATGTHRANTPDELDAMLGPVIRRDYRVVNHDARDDSSLVSRGTTKRGHPIEINRLFVDADVTIVTGFVEPHFFAGFSGGPKPVMPGVAGLRTVLANHGPDMIAHPNATFGVLDGNPLHEEQREIALALRPTFSLNVTLNKRRQITGVWAGDLLAVHGMAVEFVRRTAMQVISGEYDVVLTTNSGFPLDQNLYQSVKGLSAAARAVRDGGAIVLAAECEDGLPSHGAYADLLFGAANVEALLDRVLDSPAPIADGWQAQIQAQIQRRARVFLYSSLPDEIVRRSHFTPIHDIAAEILRLLHEAGPKARLLVLPEGPQTIVYCAQP